MRVGVWVARLRDPASSCKMHKIRFRRVSRSSRYAQMFAESQRGHETEMEKWDRWASKLWWQLMKSVTIKRLEEMPFDISNY